MKEKIKSLLELATVIEHKTMGIKPELNTILGDTVRGLVLNNINWDEIGERIGEMAEEHVETIRNGGVAWEPWGWNFYRLNENYNFLLNFYGVLADGKLTEAQYLANDDVMMAKTQIIDELLDESRKRFKKWSERVEYARAVVKIIIHDDGLTNSHGWANFKENSKHSFLLKFCHS